MNNILLYGGTVLTIFSYLWFIVLHFIGRSHKTKDNSLELILKRKGSSSINVIKSSDGIFSKYNINRSMIKLSDKSYDKSDLFSVTVSYILSGYAVLKDKFFIISKVFREVKIISFLPIVSVGIAFICNSRVDSMIGLVGLVVILIYLYMIDDINNNLIDNSKIDKDIIVFTKKIIIINRLFFISTLIFSIKMLISILM